MTSNYVPGLRLEFARSYGETGHFKLNFSIENSNFSQFFVSGIHIHTFPHNFAGKKISFHRHFKENSIHFFTTNSELKARVVERFNRTLKTRMWKSFMAKNTRVYIDILQNIMQGYNNSYHRSISRALASVSLLNVGEVRRKLYEKPWTKPGRKFKFKLGDQVHISKSRRTFKKGYLPSWTQETSTVTKIISRVPPVYRL